MSQRVNWFITDQNVTVNYNGQTHIVKRSDTLADDLIAAIKEGRNEDIPNLVSVAQAMANKSKGNVVFQDGELLVRGVKVPVELARKIRQFIDEGLPYQPLVKFAENLQQNPSFRAVNELFQFLEKNDHPFTENGNFIAYKRVRGDFKDIYTGTFDNTPGQEPEVARNQVDEDSNRTCSRGLHVANWDYAHTKYGTRGEHSTDIMLEVEVNPADVVAVPTDYNQSKMRVCKYKVLGVVETEYTGGSLRVVDPDKKDFCYECETCKPNVVHGVCTDCDDEIEEDTFCEECGDLLDDNSYEICEDCERTLEEEAEAASNDRYPYDDELNEE